VRVEALYEPPQDGTHEGFELLEDPRAEKVEELAAALNLKKVGWIFAHPPREKGFVFSGLEVLTAATEQLEAAQGVQETPFVTIRVSLERQEEEGEGKDGEEKKAAGGGEMVTHFDAFQVRFERKHVVSMCLCLTTQHPHPPIR
jgi:nuclear protein localization family protein 4